MNIEVFVVHHDLGYDGSIFLGVRSTMQEALDMCQQRTDIPIKWKPERLDSDFYMGVIPGKEYMGEFQINREEMKINKE